MGPGLDFLPRVRKSKRSFDRFFMSHMLFAAEIIETIVIELISLI